MCAVPGGDEGYRNLIRMHTSLDVDAGRRSTAPGTPRSSGSTRRSWSSPGRDPRRRRPRRRAWPRCAPTRRCSSPRASEVFEKAAAQPRPRQRGRAAWFGRLPRAACVILEMPAHEEDHRRIAYYRPPAMDGSRPGQYYVNTSDPHDAAALRGRGARLPRGGAGPPPPDRDRPGAARACRTSGATSGPTAFVEGWGLYTERLADEMGLYSRRPRPDRRCCRSTPGGRAGSSSTPACTRWAGRASRRSTSCSSTRALAANNIANEVDRYIVLPGQALAYKIGQLEILRLCGPRRSAGWATAFDIRAFHDAVLSDGALPLPTLAEVVYAWADDAVAAPARWPSTNGSRPRADDPRRRHGCPLAPTARPG